MVFGGEPTKSNGVLQSWMKKPTWAFAVRCLCQSRLSLRAHHILYAYELVEKLADSLLDHQLLRSCQEERFVCGTTKAGFRWKNSMQPSIDIAVDIKRKRGVKGSKSVQMKGIYSLHFISSPFNQLDITTTFLIAVPVHTSLALLQQPAQPTRLRQADYDSTQTNTSHIGFLKLHRLGAWEQGGG